MCNNNPQISFIIPAYNAENTIEDCVNSILRINKIKIEVIVVDDGSKDTTLTKCERINDSRLIVIHKNNEGVSVARNRGVEESRGEYIVFCDADDSIHAEEFEKVFSCVNYEDDLIMYNVERHSKGNIYIEKMILAEGEYGKEGVDYLKKRVLDVPLYCKWESNVLQGSIWRYIYKTKMLFEGHILFDKGIPYSEDLCFCLKVFNVASNIKVVDLPVYIVNEVENSASRRFREEFWEELKAVYGKVVEIAGTDNSILYCHYGRSAIKHYLSCQCFGNVKSKVKNVLDDDKFRQSIIDIAFGKKTFYECFFDWCCVHQNLYGLYLCGIYEKMFWVIMNNAVKWKSRLSIDKK